MKCENCGYSLKIEYNVCPSCGSANPFAKAHREDMAKYGQAFENTQKAVIDKTKMTAGIMVKIIICAVLLAATILMLVMTAKSYDIEKSRVVRNVRKNIESYREEFNTLEANREYLMISEWYDYNYLHRMDEFKDCLKVFNVCRDYKYLYLYVMDVTYPEYLENSVRKPYDYCKNISSQYTNMKNVMTRQSYDTDASFTKEHVDCMQDCLAEAQVLIKAAFKLTDEQIEEFDNATEAKRIVMLEENWPYEYEE